MKRIHIIILFVSIFARLAFGQESVRFLYVLNGLGQTVSKMDIATSIISNDIVPVGDIPSRIFAKDDFVYVVNSSPAGVIVIDPKTDTIVRTITLVEGSNPWSMTFVGEARAYVTNLLANSITVLDLASGDSVNTIPVGTAPQGILEIGDRVYVTNTGGFPTYTESTVSVIDATVDTVIATIDVSTNPQELALAPDGKLHVVCTGNFSDISGKVNILDIETNSNGMPIVLDTLDVGGTPGDLIITGNSIAYIADFGDNDNGFIYSYDAETREIFHSNSNPILIGRGPFNLLYELESDELYASNFNDDAVQLLNAEDGSVLSTFEFGDGAQDMAIIELSDPTFVDGEILVPDELRLFQNYPNPFNPETDIRYTIQEAGTVSLEIFNQIGQKIRTLVSDVHQPGEHRASWNGRNDRGQDVASGLYFYRLTVGSLSTSRKMVLLR